MLGRSFRRRFGVSLDKIHNRFRVGRTVRMMPLALVQDQLERSAKPFVFLLHARTVLAIRHGLVGFTREIKDGDLGRDKFGREINWILIIRQRFGFRFESVKFEETLPIRRTAFADAELPARPAFEIAHGLVHVEAGDLAGIRSGPARNGQPFAAQTHQRGLRGETELGGHVAVKSVILGNGIRCAKGVAKPQ